MQSWILEDFESSRPQNLQVHSCSHTSQLDETVPRNDFMHSFVSCSLCTGPLSDIEIALLMVTKRQPQHLKGPRFGHLAQLPLLTTPLQFSIWIAPLNSAEPTSSVDTSRPKTSAHCAVAAATGARLSVTTRTRRMPCQKGPGQRV